MEIFSDAPAVVAAVPAGVSNPLRGAFPPAAGLGRTAHVQATCPGLPSAQGTGVPGIGLMAHIQLPVFGQAPARKPYIYTTRVDAVGVKGSHPAREPV